MAHRFADGFRRCEWESGREWPGEMRKREIAGAPVRCSVRADGLSELLALQKLDLVLSEGLHIERVLSRAARVEL